LNDSGHEIIICDDYELMNIIRDDGSTGVIKGDKRSDSFKLREFKLSEEKEHEFMLKLHGVIHLQVTYFELLQILPRDINLLRVRHQYVIDGEILNISYAGFDFVDEMRRYVIRYEIKNDLEYLKRCVDEFDEALNVFPNDVWGILLIPSMNERLMDNYENINVIFEYIEIKERVHEIYVIGNNI
jgi:hypothetical protein